MEEDKMNETFKSLDVIKDRAIYIYINIKDFGAKGDGITDDTAAIQAAIDYAVTTNTKHIFIPNGVYRISNGFQFGTTQGMDFVIEGAGWNSIIKVDSNLSSPIEAVFEVVNLDAKRFQLKNFYIDCNNKAKHGFKYSGSNDAGAIKLINMRIREATLYGIDNGKIEDTVIHNSNIQDNVRGIRAANHGGTITISNTRLLGNDEFDLVMEGANHVKMTNVEMVSRPNRANILVTGYYDGATKRVPQYLEIHNAWMEAESDTLNGKEGYGIWIADTNPITLDTDVMPNNFMLWYNGYLHSDIAAIHIDENTNKRLYLFLPHIKIGSLPNQSTPRTLINIAGNGIDKDSVIVIGNMYASDANGIEVIKPYEAIAKYHVKRIGYDSSIRIGKSIANAEFGPWIPNTTTEGFAEALSFASQVAGTEHDPVNKAVVEILPGHYNLTSKVSVLMEENSRVIIEGAGERNTIIEGFIDDYVLEFKTASMSGQDYGYLEIRGLTIVNRGNVGVGHGLHTLDLNSVKLEKVWIGGKFVDINTDQLQVTNSESVPNSIGLFLEGQGAEQMTTIDTMVAGFDIAYKINVDHLTMINPQARKIGNTMFWFETCFDILLLNPHGFQIGRRDINTSGMFYFNGSVGNITAINAHLEEYSSGSYQTAMSPLINVGTITNQKMSIINGRIDTGVDNTCIIFKQNRSSVGKHWFNGFNIENLRIDDAATTIYLYYADALNNVINNDIHILNHRGFGVYGSGANARLPHNFVGDLRSDAFERVKIKTEFDNTFISLSGTTEASIYTTSTGQTYFGKYEIVGRFLIRVNTIPSTNTELNLRLKVDDIEQDTETIRIPMAVGDYVYEVRKEITAPKNTDSNIKFTAQALADNGQAIDIRILNTEIYGVIGT
ncbi:MAG: hypothetical protein KatS3mg003_1178 [Candidatus Nitrosocaldaceae archaeon]|nr:MAG: hypothetical protein KatS3mg003_1178 [Candidatus Nitrosocaldaceae archaeon]